MNFGDILDAWEKQTAIPQGENKRRQKKYTENKKAASVENKVDEKNRINALLESWLDSHGVIDKDAEMSESPIAKRHRLPRRHTDAIIDLHGLTQDEAWACLEDFFQKCAARSFERVTIIHGKGNHPRSKGALRKLVRVFIEKCPLTGESGYHTAKFGGAGATWVILKK
ncbi:MAG: Smr/MutS family protein [Treponema sp.]|jgi:DNA-nicking Smr family endonuclease|nr:Smr/MutS family protein [Treponema sp.]